MDEREKRLGLHGFWESAYKRISEYQGAFCPQWLASHQSLWVTLLTEGWNTLERCEGHLEYVDEIFQRVKIRTDQMVLYVPFADILGIRIAGDSCLPYGND